MYNKCGLFINALFGDIQICFIVLQLSIGWLQLCISHFDAGRNK